MPRESIENKKNRSRRVISLLKRYYPNAECALNYNNPLQLLVATILSAQCTDKRVNQVTTPLFKKYPSATSFAQADLKSLEQDIYSTGFFHSKAQRIIDSCQRIINQFKGEVPSRLEDLVTLPGVGRKTANVVLGTAFSIPSGVVVDTHVNRLSNRLGLTSSKDPVKIEQDLSSLLSKSSWIYFSHALILHGRQVCKSRVPRCSTCFLEELCPQKGVKH